jgi:hypothetical protein
MYGSVLLSMSLGTHQFVALKVDLENLTKTASNILTIFSLYVIIYFLYSFNNYIFIVEAQLITAINKVCFELN